MLRTLEAALAEVTCEVTLVWIHCLNSSCNSSGRSGEEPEPPVVQARRVPETEASGETREALGLGRRANAPIGQRAVVAAAAAVLLRLGRAGRAERGRAQKALRSASANARSSAAR